MSVVNPAAKKMEEQLPPKLVQVMNMRLNFLCKELQSIDFRTATPESYMLAKKATLLVQRDIDNVCTRMKAELPVDLRKFAIVKYRDLLLLAFIKQMLIGLLKNDKKSEAFIGFFNGEVTCLSNGVRLKKPCITDDNGMRYNKTSILLICTQKRKGLESIAKNAAELERTEQIVDDLKVAIAKHKAFIQDATKMMENLEPRLQQVEKANEGVRNKLMDLKRAYATSRKPELNQQILSVQESLKKSRVIEGNIRLKYDRLRSDREKANLFIVAQEKNLIAVSSKLDFNKSQTTILAKKQEPIDARFNYVLNAIFKAILLFKPSDIGSGRR